MKSRMELLAPAGGAEGLYAAVCNGADAVYLGYQDFNARNTAKNFSAHELEKAVKYCHRNGVKVYLTLNTLILDREEKAFLRSAVLAAKAGVDAFIVQDIGMVSLLREVLPDIPLHGSTQMSVHNLDGVMAAYRMGINRVILARELPIEEIAYICKNSPIEIEVFAHGALCVCYSGQCYMSSVIGERSGNRGRCAQPCRMPYKGMKGTSYPLSLKDLCAAYHISELAEAGVTSLKIEGRLKRPEYTAIVTNVYEKLIRTGKKPSAFDMDRLKTIFSRDFTDGYLTGNKGPDMLGTHLENENTEKFKRLAARAALTYKDYNSTERVEIDLSCIVEWDKKISLSLSDRQGHECNIEGETPERAIKRSVDFATVQKQLEKTGGTPYRIRSIEATIGEGLAVPLSALNDLRRRGLARLSELREETKPLKACRPTKLIRNVNPITIPYITVSALKADQIGEKILRLPIKRVYLPLTEIDSHKDTAAKIAERIPLFAVMPRTIFDSEWELIKRMLKNADELGIKGVLCTNISHIRPIKEMGFIVGGDFSLNVFNSRSVMELKKLGLSFFTPSFEMSIPQIRDLGKYISAELIVYGRFPLMLLENPPKLSDKPYLTDRKGEEFYIHTVFGGRGELYNAYPLYLSDKIENFYSIGVSSHRVCLTTESEKEGARLIENVIIGDGVRPSKFTRGLYYKGVE